MNIQDKWDQASATGEPIDIGDTVVCDYCSKDYTKSLEMGGLIFQSKAICPACQHNAVISIHKYREEKYIKAYCPPLQSFADFVRKYRGGNNKISIRKIY